MRLVSVGSWSGAHTHTYPRHPNPTSPPRPRPPSSCSGLAGLPRLRMLSLTLFEALPPACHALLGQLRQLEELHIYLTPSQPTQFEFQPGGCAHLSSSGVSTASPPCAGASNLHKLETQKPPTCLPSPGSLECLQARWPS